MIRIDWSKQLVGRKVGRLVITSVPKNAGAFDKARCQCSCGNVIHARVSRLVYKQQPRSCGCWRSERAIERARRTFTKHSQHPRSLYRKWKGMKARCREGGTRKTKNYGDRGIRVCKKWQQSFTIFRDWALANGWKEGLQIDRKKVNGHYSPLNCRFVTHSENQQNKRRV